VPKINTKNKCDGGNWKQHIYFLMFSCQTAFFAKFQDSKLRNYQVIWTWIPQAKFFSVIPGTFYTNLKLPVRDVHGMSWQPKYEIFLSSKYLDPYRLSSLRLNGTNMKNQTYLHTMYKLNIAAWMILESLLLCFESPFESGLERPWMSWITLESTWVVIALMQFTADKW